MADRRILIGGAAPPSIGAARPDALGAGLERCGYTVMHAASPHAIVATCVDRAIDVVLLWHHPGVARTVTMLTEASASRAVSMRVGVLVAEDLDRSALDAARSGAMAIPADIAPEHLDELLRGLWLAPRACTPAPSGDAGPLDPYARAPAPAPMEILGNHPALIAPLRVLDRVAPTHASVLITGESGTGKGLVAARLHARSGRADRPLVTLSCAALAQSVLESELFGHERGAFTGATQRRVGRFEQAHGGTLYLDEVSEIPLETQVKLLRVIQDRAFERVGGNETRTVDVRLVAATNRDLAEEVAAGRFREDLFYRLKVICVELPPLRERRSDIPFLARRFAERFAREYRRTVPSITRDAVDALVQFEWPGNVRELEHAIEHAVVMCSGPAIAPEHLPDSVTGPRRHRQASDSQLRIPGDTLADIERRAILIALEASNGNTLRAAQMLGISQRKIQYRLRDYGAGRSGDTTQSETG